MKTICIVFIFLFFTAVPGRAQKHLQLSVNHFGRTKLFEVHLYERFEYKLKGQFFFSKSRITNMQDSLLVLENDSVLFLRQIKSIKLNRNIHILLTLRQFFARAGIGFFTLNSLNNVILDNRPVITPVAGLVSAAALVCSLAMYELQYKRFRVGKSKTLTILDLDFERLASRGNSNEKIQK